MQRLIDLKFIDICLFAFRVEFEFQLFFHIRRVRDTTAAGLQNVAAQKWVKRDSVVNLLALQPAEFCIENFTALVRRKMSSQKIVKGWDVEKWNFTPHRLLHLYYYTLLTWCRQAVVAATAASRRSEYYATKRKLLENVTIKITHSRAQTHTHAHSFSGYSFIRDEI